MDHGAPVTDDPDTSAGAPRTDTERILADIWATVLDKEAVGIHDDFLDLDGDSLSAMRCVNRIRAAFGIELPLDVFFAPDARIAEIAARVDLIRAGAGAARQPS